MEAQLNISHATLGLLQGSFFLGFVGGSMLVPMLLRRFDAIWIIAGSMACICAGPIICGLPYVSAIVIGRLFCGLGTTGLTLFMSLLFARAFPRRQAALNCLMHACIAIGSVMSLVFSRSLADLAGSFAAPCYIVGGIAFALAIPVTLAARGIVIHPDKVGGSFKSVLGMPLYLATLAVVLAYMLAEQGSTAFASLVAEDRLGLTPVAAARTGALLWAGMILGRLLAAYPRKVKIELDIITCIGMMSLFGMLAVTTRSPWVFAVCLLLTGVFGGPILALMATFQCQRLPAHQSMALSLSAVAMGIGGAAGPAFLGGMAHQLGIGKALGFSFMILPACGAVLVLTLLLMAARITFCRAVPHLRVEIGRWKLLLSRDLSPSTEVM